MCDGFLTNHSYFNFKTIDTSNYLLSTINSPTPEKYMMYQFSSKTSEKGFIRLPVNAHAARKGILSEFLILKDTPSSRQWIKQFHYPPWFQQLILEAEQESETYWKIRLLLCD